MNVGASTELRRSAVPNPGTLYLVHVFTHATRARLDEALRHLGLSAFHYTVLSVLARNEDLSSSRLSRRFHVTPQAMGETILLLEKRGLIERREDPNNRKALLLSLTRSGRAACKEGDAIVTKLERTFFAGCSAAELDALRTTITKALTILREK
jgi:DNA-binding MarR family transcriptional regulator